VSLAVPAPETLLVAWQAGYDYAIECVNSAADDLTHCDAKPPPAVSYEQRVAERVAQFERYARQAGVREWLGAERGDEVTPW
jgi:hypothetical protein